MKRYWILESEPQQGWDTDASPSAALILNRRIKALSDLVRSHSGTGFKVENMSLGENGRVGALCFWEQNDARFEVILPELEKI